MRNKNYVENEWMGNKYVEPGYLVQCTTSVRDYNNLSAEDIGWIGKGWFLTLEMVLVKAVAVVDEPYKDVYWKCWSLTHQKVVVIKTADMRNLQAPEEQYSSLLDR